MALDAFQVLALFLRNASGEWLLGDGDIPRIESDEVESLFAREACRLETLNISLPARVAYTPRIFAHLFAGNRRADDFQHFVEFLGARAISVDIIYDIRWGDLLRAETSFFPGRYGKGR